MNFNEMLVQLSTSKEAIVFNDFMALVDSLYHFTPAAFGNGTLHNAANENNGSCKLFAFAQLNEFSANETLFCFGEHYQEVRSTPNGDSHQNIRNFIQQGWDDVHFDTQALKLK